MQADHGVFHGDAYAVLGVKRTADVAEIKQAWKRKMLECHPDGDAARGRSKAGAAARNEQAKLINGAWNTLKKPERRIQYDECYPTAGTDGETPRRPTWSRPEPTSDADAETRSRPTASTEPTDDAGGYRRRRRSRTERSGRDSDRPPGYTGQRNPDEPYHDPTRGAATTPARAREPAARARPTPAAAVGSRSWADSSTS